MVIDLLGEHAELHRERERRGEVGELPGPARAAALDLPARAELGGQGGEVVTGEGGGPLGCWAERAFGERRRHGVACYTGLVRAMCGRYTLTDQSTLVDELELARGEPTDAASEWWRPRWNIAPTQPARSSSHATASAWLELMRWGLVPHWADDLKRRRG